MKTSTVGETLALDELMDRCRRAAQILVTNETKQRYPTGEDAFGAAPIVPELMPQTRADAIPNILIVGPFQDEPNLTAIAIWVGIGIIEIHRSGTELATYEFLPMVGEGLGVRNAYLMKAFGLYFNDVQFVHGGVPS